MRRRRRWRGEGREDEEGRGSRRGEEEGEKMRKTRGEATLIEGTEESMCVCLWDDKYAQKKKVRK